MMLINIEKFLLYYTQQVIKKMICNSCKNLVSVKDNEDKMPEINSYFQGFNRGSLLYLLNNKVIKKIVFNQFFTIKIIQH